MGGEFLLCQGAWNTPPWNTVIQKMKDKIGSILNRDRVTWTMKIVEAAKPNDK